MHTRQKQIKNSSCETLKILNLTSRETDVLACLLSGKTTKKLAIILDIKLKTVKSHIHNLMQKLDRHTKETLIEFAEKRGYTTVLRQHYTGLLMLYEFNQSLLKLTPIIATQKITSHLVADDKQLIARLSNDLKQFGIKIILKKSHKACLTIRIEKELPAPNSEDKACSVVLFEDHYYTLFFSVLYCLAPHQAVQERQSYFTQQFQPINGAAGLSIEQKVEQKPDSTKQGQLKMFITLLCTAMILIVIILYVTTRMNKYETIRSPMMLPDQDKLLQRPHILKQIDAMLAQQKQAVKIVVLVGLGGIGKTILARQYAKNCQAYVVWEINAETQKTLFDSFLDLAYVLSKTQYEKQDIDMIKEVQDVKERTKRLLNFVKKKLRQIQPWVLLFDNVENFLDIQYFFSCETWGKGKIMVTTRNEHIKNSAHIKTNHVIHLPPLNDLEKFILFTQITFEDKQRKLIEEQQKIIGTFLLHIPPFPLDVSIAAYYIKYHKRPYKEYLHHLQTGRGEFAKRQFAILKETSDYAQTRYSIIASTIEPLIKACPDFAELLLLISMVGADHIPLALLDQCKGKILCDHFMQSVTKHSLIDNAVMDRCDSLHANFSIHRSVQEMILTFLIHRLDANKKRYHFNNITNSIDRYFDTIIDRTHTTQMQNLLEHLRVFLRHKQLLDRHNKILLEVQLGRIYYHLGDFLKARPYLEQGLCYLRQKEEVNRDRIARILADLGTINKEAGKIEEGKRLLEQSLDLYQRYFQQNQKDKAWVLFQLGSTYTRLGNYEKAKHLIEQSIAIYEQQYGEVHEKLAVSLVHLGALYRVLGAYEQAKQLYERSLAIYKQLSDKDYTYVIGSLGTIAKRLGDYAEARTLLEKTRDIYEKKCDISYDALSLTLTFLGDTYRAMGLHEKADKALQRALTIRIKHYGKDNILTIHTAVHLAKLLLDQQDYTAAQNLLEYSMNVYEKRFDAQSIRRAWAAYYLARTYKNLGDLKKSETLFAYSLPIYQKHYGEDHIQTARILRDLGSLYQAQGNYEKAQVTIKKALSLFKKAKHPDYYTCLESLGDLYMTQYQKGFNVKIKAKDKVLKNNARQCFKEALDITKSCFPKDSAHPLRLKVKLKNSKQGSKFPFILS